MGETKHSSHWTLFGFFYRRFCTTSVTRGTLKTSFTQCGGGHTEPNTCEGNCRVFKGNQETSLFKLLKLQTVLRKGTVDSGWGRIPQTNYPARLHGHKPKLHQLCVLKKKGLRTSSGSPRGPREWENSRLYFASQRSTNTLDLCVPEYGRGGPMGKRRRSLRGETT